MSSLRPLDVAGLALALASATVAGAVAESPTATLRWETPPLRSATPEVEACERLVLEFGSILRGSAVVAEFSLTRLEDLDASGSSASGYAIEPKLLTVQPVESAKTDTGQGAGTASSEEAKVDSPTNTSALSETTGTSPAEQPAGPAATTLLDFAGMCREGIEEAKSISGTGAAEPPDPMLSFRLQTDADEAEEGREAFAFMEGAFVWILAEGRIRWTFGRPADLSPDVIRVQVEEPDLAVATESPVPAPQGESSPDPGPGNPPETVPAVENPPGGAMAGLGSGWEIALVIAGTILLVSFLALVLLVVWVIDMRQRRRQLREIIALVEAQSQRWKDASARLPEALADAMASQVAALFERLERHPERAPAAPSADPRDFSGTWYDDGGHDGQPSSVEAPKLGASPVEPRVDRGKSLRSSPARRAETPSARPSSMLHRETRQPMVPDKVFSTEAVRRLVSMFNEQLRNGGELDEFAEAERLETFGSESSHGNFGVSQFVLRDLGSLNQRNSHAYLVGRTVQDEFFALPGPGLVRDAVNPDDLRESTRGFFKTRTDAGTRHLRIEEPCWLHLAADGKLEVARPGSILAPS